MDGSLSFSVADAAAKFLRPLCLAPLPFGCFAEMVSGCSSSPSLSSYSGSLVGA